MSNETKRRTLSPAERVAKLEAELEAARKKAEAKTQKQADALIERRKTLLDQINERWAKVEAIEAELAELGYEVASDTTDKADEVEPANDELRVV